MTKPIRLSERKKRLSKQLAKENIIRLILRQKGLVLNKTNTSDWVIPDINNPFFAQLVKSGRPVFAKNGYFGF